jgi:mutator protein MutT
MPPPVLVALAVVVDRHRCLVQLRCSRDTLNGLWEFPGGKMQPGETAAQAAVRECVEEAGLMVQACAELPMHRASYPHSDVMLHPVVCRPVHRGAGSSGIGSSCPGSRSGHWVEVNHLSELAMPPINAAIVADLLRFLSENQLTSG